MDQPRLIGDYLTALAARLPAGIVAELADGLNRTYLDHLGRGLTAPAAAQAAIAEFGDPHTITAAFLATLPARRAARILLATGPVAGGCWASALLLRQAWTWPVGAPPRVLLGTLLLATVAVLATAVLTQPTYRRTRVLTAAGCLGVLTLDTTMLAYVTSTGFLVAWPVTLAAIASLTRTAVTLHTLPAVLAN